MRTIEATVTISADRKLEIVLPPDITPGEHRVLVVVYASKDEATDRTSDDQTGETPMRWDDGVLVYDGQGLEAGHGPETFATAIEAAREQRMLDILAGWRS